MKNKFISDGDTFELVAPAPVKNDWEEVPRDKNGQWTDGNIVTVGEFSYKRQLRLSEKHTAIERKFGKEIGQNLQQYKERYFAENGNIVNTDQARELSEDYRMNRGELSAAVHEPSSLFVKHIYKDLLDREPVSNSVYFTAGGTGAGKTTATRSQQLNSMMSNADAVYDGNLSSYDSSIDKIELALKTGRNVHIVYVYRDPEEAFEEGVIPRMLKPESAGGGRSVPIDEHVNTHSGSMETIQKIYQKYKDNPKVTFVIFANIKGKGSNEIDIHYLSELGKGRDYKKIKQKLYESTERKRRLGIITENQYRGLTSKTE